MDTVQFEMKAHILCVRYKDELLFKPRLDTQVVKNAVQHNLISPAMKDGMFKKFNQELKDNGLNPTEIKSVIAKFETYFVK